MFQQSEIKVEKFSNTICFCCLSINRVLRPLGMYRNILFKIMGDDKNCLDYTEESLICWECMSFLKRTLEFHKKVLKASFMLSSMELSHFQNNSLSTLDLVWIPIIYETETEVALKDEEKELIKIELTNEKNNIDGINSTVNNTNSDVPLEYDDDDFKNDIESTGKLEMKKKNAKRKIFTKDTYKRIITDRITFKGQYCLIRVDPKELREMMNQERMSKQFRNAIHKCGLCIRTFRKSSDKLRHDKVHHSKCNKLVCDICAQTFSTKQSLVIHCKSHDYKYKCCICRDNLTYYCREKMYKHFRYYHRALYVCKICDGLPLGCRAEFVTHYREFHMKFTCDHCMKTYNKKEPLISHISKHHSILSCTICKKSYRLHRHYASHMRHFHPVTEQNAYCVECNLVFKTDLLYKRHLRTSVKHKAVVKKSFPCPKCNKIYLKHCTMMYHYNYVHENKSKFICDKCQRSFLNGFRLRQHIANVHDKIPKEKNKMCTYCGRGFNTNKILSNHILTHTGERPHKCDHCGTTFAQKCALKYHLKNIHYKHLSAMDVARQFLGREQVDLSL